LDQAIELGVIDEVATFADLMHADFVIVSVPVDVRLLSSFEAIERFLKWVLQNYLFVGQSSQKEKFYSYASYCWNGIFGTIGSDKRLVSRKNKHYL
jgi:prephenate dehydrogenase